MKYANQNKSVYTRRFNKLRKELIKQLDAKEHTIEPNSWGFSGTVTGHGWGSHDYHSGFCVYYVNDLGDIEFTIEIHKNQESVRCLSGIHVRDTDIDHILDQIDVCTRDGFEKIYIHSIAA